MGLLQRHTAQCCRFEPSLGQRDLWARRRHQLQVRIGLAFEVKKQSHTQRTHKFRLMSVYLDTCNYLMFQAGSHLESSPSTETSQIKMRQAWIFSCAETGRQQGCTKLGDKPSLVQRQAGSKDAVGALQRKQQSQGRRSWPGEWQRGLQPAAGL